MTEIWRSTFNWTGNSIGAGSSHFYCGAATAAQTFATACQTFMVGATKKASNGDVIPLGISIAQVNTLDKIEATTGKLTGQVSVTPGTTITGSGGQGYSAASGSCITWNTNDFLNGRRVRDRTFIVPLTGSGLDAQGTLDDTYRTALLAACTTFIGAATGLCVFHRPTTKGGTNGNNFAIQNAHVTDKVAILTTRR